MSARSPHELVAMGDSDQTIAGTEDDIRGRTVVDAGGEELGRVDDFLVDEGEGRVRFLVVESGGFLGIGADQTYIPVEAIAEVGDVVRIDRSRDVVAAAPRYDPDVVSEESFSDRAYGYFGLTPYWMPGYAGSPYPRVAPGFRPI